MTIQTSEARLETKKKNVEKVWAKFDAIVMIRRGGGLARGFIQLAVEEKEIAGAEAEGIVDSYILGFEVRRRQLLKVEECKILRRRRRVCEWMVGSFCLEILWSLLRCFEETSDACGSEEIWGGLN